MKPVVCHPATTMTLLRRTMTWMVKLISNHPHQNPHSLQILSHLLPREGMNKYWIFRCAAMLGWMSLILTELIIQHKLYINIRIEIGQKIWRFSLIINAPHKECHYFHQYGYCLLQTDKITIKSNLELAHGILKNLCAESSQRTYFW